MPKSIFSFPDHTQNFWQLASSQTPSIGINGSISAKIISIVNLEERSACF